MVFVSSELERIAQRLGNSVEGAPVMVGQLRQMAAECRREVALLNALADLDPSVGEAARALEAAARSCEDGAREASRSPAKETAWAEGTAGGVGNLRRESALPALKVPRVRFDLVTATGETSTGSGAVSSSTDQDSEPAPGDGALPGRD